MFTAVTGIVELNSQPSRLGSVDWPSVVFGAQQSYTIVPIEPPNPGAIERVFLVGDFTDADCIAGTVT